MRVEKAYSVLVATKFKTCETNNTIAIHTRNVMI